MSDNNNIILYGTNWCGGSRRISRFFDEHEIPYHYVNIDADKNAALFVESVNRGFRSVPTIVWPDGSMLVEPSLSELAKKMGVDLP